MSTNVSSNTPTNKKRNFSDLVSETERSNEDSATQAKKRKLDENISSRDIQLVCQNDTNAEIARAHINRTQEEQKESDMDSNSDPAVSLTTCQLRPSIKPIIEDILTSGAGDVSVGGEAEDWLPGIPGLFVHHADIGHVSLPICDLQAKQLIQICQQSAYGNGLNTETDTDVRNSFELTAEQFAFENSAWHAGVQSLAQHAASALGCSDKMLPRVSAHRYKLLIYQRGGHFKVHRDTQKLDGMFATLIVQLPSRFTTCEGRAALIVEHNNLCMKYFTDFADAPFASYFAAHHCDLMHEVSTIESGYRVVVTYNICWGGPQSDIPQVKSGAVSRIARCLQNWSEPLPVAISLDHLYTENELSRQGVACLKGRDGRLVSAIKTAGLYLKQWALDELVICVAEGTRETVCDEDCGEVNREESTGLWFDQHGNNFSRIGDGIELEFDDVIKLFQDAPDDYDDDETWHQVGRPDVERTGNEGTTITTQYRCFVLVFWKKSTQFEMRLQYGGVSLGLRIVEAMLKKDRREHALNRLQRLIASSDDAWLERNQQHLWSYGKRDDGICDSIVQILKHIVDFNQPRLFSDFVCQKVCADNISSIRLTTGLVQSLIGVIGKFGLADQHVRPAVAKLCHCSSKFGEGAYQAFLSEIQILFDKNSQREFHSFAAQVAADIIAGADRASKVAVRDAIAFFCHTAQRDACASFVGKLSPMSMCNENVTALLSAIKSLGWTDSFKENMLLFCHRVAQYQVQAEPAKAREAAIIIRALCLFQANIGMALQSSADSETLTQITDQLLRGVLDCFLLNENHFNNLSSAASVELLQYFVQHCELDCGDKKSKGLKTFESVYLRNVEQAKQQEIATLVMKKAKTNRSLKSNAVVHNILFVRLRYLLETAPKAPVFTWRMDIDVDSGNQNETAFVEFLRSDRQEFRKQGFTGIVHARKWAAKMAAKPRSLYMYRNNTSQNQPRHSVDCKPQGTGRNAFVLCAKTKDLFNQEFTEFQRSPVQIEIKKLRDYLGVSD